MTRDEIRFREKGIVLIAAGAAAILIAAIVGLSLGKGAATEVDPKQTPAEVYAEARDNTLSEVRKSSAKQGFLEGKESGTDQGRRAGKRAGQLAGRAETQQQLTAEAQSAAAEAQAALSAVSIPPPAPPAPVPSAAGPVTPGQ